MKRHHFEEDGVFDWSNYGTNVLTPRKLAAENDNESQSKKSPNQKEKIGKMNNNNNNNNDLQVPFIPILHQVFCPNLECKTLCNQIKMPLSREKFTHH